jgi:molecular chaperone DnaK (HSP70)
MEKVTIKIPYASGRNNLIEDLTIDDLKRISDPIIERAIEPIWDALEKANLEKEDIDLVILAGGSSQLPGVYSKIRDAIGVEPRIIPKNLMLAISYGASLYQRDVFDLPKIKRDVRTLGSSLGLMIDDGGRRGVKLLLNHNDPLPARSEHTFEIADGQTEVSLNLVTLLGNTDKVDRKLKQRNLKLSKGASQVKVEITVTENKLIELTAYDPKHKDEKSIIQVDRQTMSEQDIADKRNQLGIKMADDGNKNHIQPCIGIDLGTTTTELTYTNRSGDVELMYLVNPEAPAQYSEYCFPSVIYFKNGIENPEIANTKACDALGNSDDSENVCGSFKIANRNKYVISIDGKGLSVSDLSAILLSKVWKTAKEYFDDMDLKSAVVTVPAAFDFDACQDTFNAAKTAGIENVTLIDEPTAAYLYYSHIQGFDTTNIKNVLVFDFGGGTADVAVLDVKNEAYSEAHQYKECLYSVLGVSGAVSCGGKSIDDAIVDEIRKRFEEKYNCTITATNLKRLRTEVEKAKVELSEKYNENGEE